VHRARLHHYMLRDRIISRITDHVRPSVCPSSGLFVRRVRAPNSGQTVIKLAYLGEWLTD